MTLYKIQKLSTNIFHYTFCFHIIFFFRFILFPHFAIFFVALDFYFCSVLVSDCWLSYCCCFCSCCLADCTWPKVDCMTLFLVFAYISKHPHSIPLALPSPTPLLCLCCVFVCDLFTLILL